MVCPAPRICLIPLLLLWYFICHYERPESRATIYAMKRFLRSRPVFGVLCLTLALSVNQDVRVSGPLHRGDTGSRRQRTKASVPSRHRSGLGQRGHTSGSLARTQCDGRACPSASDRITIFCPPELFSRFNWKRLFHREGSCRRPLRGALLPPPSQLTAIHSSSVAPWPPGTSNPCARARALAISS